MSWSQETPKDSVKTGYNTGKIKIPNPNSIESKYTYDPISDRYIYTQKIGNFNINYPLILKPEEYYDLVAKENLRSYYKEKIDAFDGKKEGAEDGRKNLLPEFYVKSGLFESIFGGNTIEVIPQGSVEMDLGVLYSRQDNPTFSPRNRSNFTFDFDQRISLSLVGKVGTRLQVNANYDTQSTFDFQNLIKLEFTPQEDDIIQKIEVGNVSMPLNSSLITGAQSLFGVKAQLQFGKTTVTGVFSEQKSQSNTVIAQGGGTLEEFDFFIRDYDENRHFFLAQYFRDEYDKALANYPFINNKGLQITRLEVWVTNRSNRTENVRNIIALQDIGESFYSSTQPDNDNLLLDPLPYPAFINTTNAFPDNGNNDYDPTAIGSSSILTEQIRDISTADQGFGALNNQVNEGGDYAKLENARKLSQGQEYTLNTELGYISLNQRLNNDEVLAVAFQYTLGGQVYQVGEFANDGVDATDVGTNNQGQVTSVVNTALVLKMLKSSITNVTHPVWDLMMKNIYATGAYNLSQDDFKLNVFYNEASPLNFIKPVGADFALDINGNPVSGGTNEKDLIQNVPLLRVFNLDKLNFNNDPQTRGDGFFDFVPGITVMTENGNIIFTSAEPFGEYLFNLLGGGDYEDNLSFNEDQNKYVYDVLYKSTKTAALDAVEKNKFKLKGRYKSSGGGEGIPIGAFNVPRGSVRVTAGGRVLVEGIDYTVNYQLGRVQILDESLKASNTPIQVSTENNAVFGQQTRRFTGVNVEHQFNENFLLGATLLNLNERPVTQKANFGTESINNTIFGLNGNYATKVPFLTRLANKLPNIDTDVESNLSLRGEFAYLAPGAPKGTDLNGEATSYVDDFEGSQNGIDLKSQQSWFLSSRPLELGVPSNPNEDDSGIQNGFQRGMLNWYTIDPIFYSSQRPDEISDEDLSGLYTSRVFINELFPDRDLVQGQNSILFTLDLAYYPNERGPYNFDPSAADGTIDNPQDSWAGITRQITSTDFEQQNVEYIDFWLQDPFQEDPSKPGGKLVFNLGNISEDIIKDGKKLYENGLPKDGDISLLRPTTWGTVTPQNQSLIYAFDTTGNERTNQDTGYDGYVDANEAPILDNPENDPLITELNEIYSNFRDLSDPSNDNYSYFLNAEGDIFERYKKYNGVQGNTPDSFSNTDRGANTQPDVEDINRDNTMNTIDSYFEYELDVTRQNLPTSQNDFDNLPDSNPLKKFLRDFKERPRQLPNGEAVNVRWYQFRVPVQGPHVKAVGGITDLRSVRFSRMYLKGFTEPTVFRFGSLDLVRSDWRRYTFPLDKNDPDPDDTQTEFSVGVVGTLENEGRYQSPPGIEPERLFNNNTVVRQNEQSLVVKVCGLEPRDSRGVFKNISLDMRQYKRMRMFMHTEDQDQATGNLDDNDLVGFIRMGNDLIDNFYQIELPLEVSTSSTREGLWPLNNEINLPIEILGKIKAEGISNMSLADEDPTFYDVINGDVIEVTDPFSGYVAGQHRVAIKGNPNYGDIRTLMVGVKNATTGEEICAETWFNELRLSDLDNEGGWAAVLSMDTNIADFANITASGRRSTSGFGSLEQGPSQRSLEDVQQYDVVTNINIGQLLPKKWGVQVPFNYGQSEELITPKYDQFYKDLTLDSRLDAADSNAEKDDIKEQSEDYTKRQSINFIGVRKIRTTDKKPRFYDVENLTFNYSYNKVEHRDFEIENSVNKTLRLGANYAHSFNPLSVEPFKKNDSLFTGKYWKFLKDFNFNLMPASFVINSDLSRQFNRQKFREVDLTGDNIGIEELYRRNYTFDFDYTINYNLTKSLQLNFTASNNNIVRNYFKNNDLIAGEQDENLDVWDGLLDVGDPNRQTQNFGLTYQIPLNKIPTFSFLDATYQYNGTFQWQKGSDLYGNIMLENDPTVYDLGNTIQNSNVHNINASMDMNRLYKYIGLTKKPIRRSRNRTSSPGEPPGTDASTSKPPKSKSQGGTKILNAGIDILTMVKRIQVNYSENNGTFLPGYTQTPGFIGTLRPTVGFTFGSQSDVRFLAAKRGWLTAFPEFNQQYTTTHTKQIDLSASLQPVRDLKIDIIGNRAYYENYAENFRVDRLIDGDYEYNSLTPNTFGNFSISTLLIKTAFQTSDEFNSAAFDDFRSNRLKIADRLAEEFYGTTNYDRDDEGYPLGFGKNNQKVLLPSFLAAYQGSDAEKITTRAFRDVPIPNWDLKYTGFMKFDWFKKRFRRFSLTHGYRSAYTINQFTTNLNLQDGDYPVPGLPYNDPNQPDNGKDQSGNFKNQTLYSNVNLTEMFSPLFRLDFEMKNSIKILAEMRKDRLLSLSFDNNLVTEVKGNEYIIGLGYRIKDLRIRSKLAGPSKRIVSDLNMKADISVRDNKTIIRYLDLENNQITSGQTIWGVKYSADYAFSKNLTGIFYLDYTFSEYAISTAFPQTTVRSGITIRYNFGN